MRIVVFGAGMQGKVIAQNLFSRPEQPEVVLADIREPNSLPTGVTFQKVDVLNSLQVKDCVQGADATVLAVPSQIAKNALSNLIACSVKVADVCFTPDPPLDLDTAAKQTGACCIVDCGIAPGLSHILAATAYSELDGLDTLKIFVGGMPADPPPVFRHAIYFNARDLVSEYIRPARARDGGKNIAPSPMEVAVEQFEDSELGLLEAFLSDGLRSLLSSFPDIPNMTEKTLRWKGHFDTMRSLYELGLFANGSTDAVADALAERYPADKHPDLLVMKVEGTKGSKRKAWRLIDRCSNGDSAMSRTTGYTTAAVAMLLAKGLFTEPGVHAPEVLGKDARLTSEILADLSARGLEATAV